MSEWVCMKMWVDPPKCVVSPAALHFLSHSRLPRTRYIWLTIQQRQWPQLSALRVGGALAPALHDALAQTQWGETRAGRRTIRNTSRS